MKIVIRIFGVLAVLVTLGICLAGVVRNFGDAEKIETEFAEFEEQMSVMEEAVEDTDGATEAQKQQIQEEFDQLKEGIPSPGAFQAAGVMLILLALLTFASAIFLFKASKKATMILGATAVIAIINIVITPHVEETLTSGMSNKTIAIIVGIGAIICALLAFAISKMKPKTVVA